MLSFMCFLARRQLDTCDETRLRGESTQKLQSMGWKLNVTILL
jgi:hypothetical protein